MIRTMLACVVLFAGIVWFPVWAQVLLFIFAVILVPYRIALLIPAVFADALYSPISSLSFAHFRYTAVVGVLLLGYLFIIKKTRIAYGRTI